MNAKLSRRRSLAECRHLTAAQSCHPQSRRALAPGPATFSCSDELRDGGRWLRELARGYGVRCKAARPCKTQSAGCLDLAHTLEIWFGQAISKEINKKLRKRKGNTGKKVQQLTC